MIIYKKGSLFDAPKGSILVHACNMKGVWGSGIAVQFKQRFIKSYLKYSDTCVSSWVQIGSGLLLSEENGYRVGCLLTSNGYGKEKDSVEEILKHTRTALVNILTDKSRIEGQRFHSCKFNSGLFGVPWELTEKVMLETFKEHNFTEDWTVWEI